MIDLRLVIPSDDAQRLWVRWFSITTPKGDVIRLLNSTDEVSALVFEQPFYAHEFEQKVFFPKGSRFTLGFRADAPMDVRIGLIIDPERK